MKPKKIEDIVARHKAKERSKQQKHQEKVIGKSSRKNSAAEETGAK